MKARPLTESEKLRKVALYALNSIYNTEIGMDEYKDTYALCSAIGKYFKNKEKDGE